jgi:annexin A7/11
LRNFYSVSSQHIIIFSSVASPNRKKKANLIEKDIKEDTSGDFKRLLIAAVQANRSEIGRDRLERSVEEQMANGKGTGIFNINYQKLADVEAAKRDADLLFKAGNISFLLTLLLKYQLI